MTRFKKIFMVILSVICLSFTFAACQSTNKGNSDSDDSATPIPVALHLKNYKTNFTEGDEFSVGDLVVEAEYDDASKVILSAENYEVDYSAYNKDVAGTYNIEVKALGLTKTYSVNVAAKIVCTKIEFVSGTTEFTSGDEFTYKDIVVKATYSDEKTKIVPLDDLQVDSTDFDSTQEGTYVITISAYGVKTTYEVTVSKIDGLNVLMIGNSFSEDTVRWVYDIAKDLGIENVNVCNMYIGGCSIDTHYANAVNNRANYDFQVYKNGTWEHNTGKTLQYGIKYANWDYISLQQSSGVSGVYTSYANLQNLMDYVKQNATKPNVKLVWNMTWAYSANSTHGEFVNYDRDQLKMYNAIADCVKKEVLTKDFYKVIPNGTAIQNIRTSFIGDNLTRDGYHLTYDLGRFVAGLNLVYTLTGADITQLNYTPSGVPSAYKQVVIESILNAAEKPYEYTKSQYLTEPEFITDEEIATKNLVKMNYLPVGNAYYNAMDTNYNKLITNAGNCPQFVTTAKWFTKEELPIGSIIILKRGWQYRPEAWTDDVKQTSRPDITTSPRVDIDAEWWGNYKYRAFNIAKVGTPALKGEFSQALDAFTIYVPQGTPLATTPDYSSGDEALLTANGKNISEMKQLDLLPIIGFYNSTITTTPILQTPSSLNNKFVSSDVLTRATLPVGSVIIIDKDYQCRPDAWVSGTKTTSRPATVSAKTETTVINVTSEWWGNYDALTLITAKIGMPEIHQTPYEVFKHVRVYVPNN